MFEVQEWQMSIDEVLGDMFGAYIGGVGGSWYFRQGKGASTKLIFSPEIPNVQVPNAP